MIETSEPQRTIASFIEPHYISCLLGHGLGHLTCPSASRVSTTANNPRSNASICLQGLRSPVISITASDPRRSRAPFGRAIRSIPRVVIFSPIAPGLTLKPRGRSSSNNSSCRRCTCRRFGACIYSFAQMGIAFDAEVRNEPDQRRVQLAEGVTSAATHRGDDGRHLIASHDAV
jgi:hypothetical protein